MDLPFGLEIASGSVIGFDHLYAGKLLIGKNNQDAVGIYYNEKALAAVVCDGCGAEPHSEVGAQLIAKRLPAMLCNTVRFSRPDARDAIKICHQWLLDMLSDLGGNMELDRRQLVKEYLLCTVVGVLVTKDTVTHFNLGDGATTFPFGLLGATPVLTSLGPFPNNMPPYLAYALTDTKMDRSLLEFHTECSPLDWFNAVLFGSDGLLDLEKAADKYIPGQKELVGPISQFWKDNKYFTNPDAIRRRLHRINAGAVHVELEESAIGAQWPDPRLVRTPGLLPDDTSLVVIRKKPCA